MSQSEFWFLVFGSLCLFFLVTCSWATKDSENDEEEDDNGP